MEKDIKETAQQPSQHLVELRSVGLIKRYGARTVADNVSFHVRQGEIVGLLGPNGAGKTTSFYMTTGLVVPNGGHVYLDGKEITDYPVYKRPGPASATCRRRPAYSASSAWKTTSCRCWR